MSKVIETREYAGTWETKVLLDDGNEEWVSSKDKPKDLEAIIKIADDRAKIVIPEPVTNVAIEEKYTPAALKAKLSKMEVTASTTWQDIDSAKVVEK